jgi:hypothetical protein
MSLPKDYNQALHKHANFYAAWFPVTMPFGVGDYGVFQDGVFQKIGHLNDVRDDGFDVQIRTAKGEPVSIDFLSEGVSSVKTVAGAPVADLPSVADLEAKLTYEFHKKNSFVVKAAEMNVERMDNIRDVADRLAKMRRDGKWSHRYCVVSTTYTGLNCLVLLSSEAGTKVEFEASASALKQLDLGNFQIKPSVSFSSDKILRSMGKTGVLGLGLFKLTIFRGNLKLLGPEDPLTAEEQTIQEDLGDEIKDWDEEPE